MAAAPPCAGFRMGCICSQMPIFFSISTKLTPAAAPPAASRRPPCEVKRGVRTFCLGETMRAASIPSLTRSRGQQERPRAFVPFSTDLVPRLRALPPSMLIQQVQARRFEPVSRASTGPCGGAAARSVGALVHASAALRCFLRGAASVAALGGALNMSLELHTWFVSALNATSEV